ncbi:MAG: carotenoid biosynthesis protein [Bacteroidota bacterium]
MSKKEFGFSLFLTSMYVGGLFGIALPIHPDFIYLTPFNLMVSLGIAFWFHPKWDQALFLFLVISFTTGFLVELLGVQSGLIFGEYEYGEVLGWKIGGTPLMIGVNWAMLVYASAATVQHFWPKAKTWVKVVMGAAAMVLLDLVIEPVAIHFDFWTWGAVEVPIQNYIAWFLVALPLHAAFHRLLGAVTNKVAIVLFTLQFLFFGTLLLTVHG